MVKMYCMDKILVSSCLLGEKVRYNGGSLTVSSPIMDQWIVENRIVTFCPEVDAGMPIPRNPVEIAGGDGFDVLNKKARVLESSGLEVTQDYLRGAQNALKLCREMGITVAVLAQSSPSCGSGTIYDGLFHSRKIDGTGVTAALLRINGVQVFSQDSLQEACDALIRAAY